MSIRVGDIVTRKSYGSDILFFVTGFNKTGTIAFLRGLEFRLVADAPLDDLIVADPQVLEVELKKNLQKSRESLRLIRQERRLMKEKHQWQATGYTEKDGSSSISFEIPGKVLHLDGDSGYMEKCLQLYRELGIPVQGVHLPENQMPAHVQRLLTTYRPDILVITGHDAYRRQAGTAATSLDLYRNSRFFVQAVMEARKYERSLDDLVIFAGACQSDFESLIAAGANFASSPKRINIHTLDPVYIVEKVAYTSVRDTINVFDMAKNTITGLDGLGGVETFGTFRLGLPVTENMQQKKHEENTSL